MRYNHVSFVFVCAALAIGTGVTACSSDSESGANSGGSDGGGGGGDPLYAIGGATYSTEGISGYVAVVPSLAAGVAIDYTRVLSLPGGGRLWGAEAAMGAFFVLKDQDASLTKYEIGEDGSFVERGKLSFTAYGISQLNPESGSRVDVVSATKAYMFDATTSQAIVWDPSTMTISKSIDLAGLALDGWSTKFGFSRTLLRGSQLVVFTFYENMTEQKFAPDLRLALIDIASDTATIVTDSRCSTMYATTTAAGDVYFSSDGRGASYHRVDAARSPAPCMLRLPVGANALDTFKADLASLTDNSASAGLIPAADGNVFVLALDETLAPVTPTTPALQIYASPAWRWWKVALGSTSPGTRTAAPPTSAGVVFMTVDGETYANESAADYSQTTLVKTSAGEPAPGIVVRGIPTSILRIR